MLLNSVSIESLSVKFDFFLVIVPADEAHLMHKYSKQSEMQIFSVACEISLTTLLLKVGVDWSSEVSEVERSKSL